MRYVWISLFILVILGLAFGPSLIMREPHADEELLIISPHWDGIRHEFGRAFSEKYLKETGKNIRVVWLDIGATGEIKKYLNERFGQVKPEEGINADILFGGGMDMLPQMAERNFFQPYELSPKQEELLRDSVGGLELRDKKNLYHAACLSSFGFVYNKQVIETARLPKPERWEDLTRPEYQGWISCGNPAQSGAIHMTFELILQGQGWERGYSVLTRMLSNVRGFNEGGSSVPRDVSLGQAAVGPCIDFYASAPIRRQGATHLQLVLPKGQSVATPDCIAILRHPPNPRGATKFMDFVLSEEGQKLWYLPRGAEGGPLEYDLERLPVMPHIYNLYLQTHTVTNPFKDIPDFRYDSRKGGTRWSTMDDLWRAAIIDVHDRLWDARKAVIAAGRDRDLGMELARAPFSEEALMAFAKKRMLPDERNKLRNKWSAWARDWYQQIEKAARVNGQVPAFTPAPLE